jgi:hypothetical protein
MDPRALIAFLNRVKCWIPEYNGGIRGEIDQVIQQLRNSIR